MTLALGNPVFHRWAPHSLVLAVVMVRSTTELMNNKLGMDRQSAVAGFQFAERDIAELKIRVQGLQDLIVILQHLLDGIMPAFGVTVKKDTETEEITQKITTTLTRQSSSIQELDKKGS